MCGKWIEAVKSRDGDAIYAVPCHARSILKITIPLRKDGASGNDHISTPCKGRTETADGSRSIEEARANDGKKRWRKKKS